MKTLYININGEDIQSSEDLMVIGKPKDAIINEFYYELGKEILKEVNTNIKKRDIIMDFKTHNENSFNSIVEQWETLKLELLGENPTGFRNVNLPDEYISWLQNSSQPVYAKIAKSLHRRGRTVAVSLDKIYKNSIGNIINNIELDDCKDCKQFIVNDNAVTENSSIAKAAQSRLLKKVLFVPYAESVYSSNKNKLKPNIDNSSLEGFFAVKNDNGNIALFDTNGKIVHDFIFLPFEHTNLNSKNVLIVADNTCIYLATRKELLPIEQKNSLCVPDLKNQYIIDGKRIKVLVNFPFIQIDECVQYQIISKHSGALITRYMTNCKYYKYVNNALVIANKENWENALSTSKQQNFDKYYREIYSQTKNDNIVDFYYYARFNGEKPNGSYIRYRNKDVFHSDRRIESVRLYFDKLIEVVFINKSACVIDTSGRIITSIGRYDQVKPLSNKFLKVCSDSRCGVIDLCGNEIIPINYSNIQFIDY